MKGRKNIEMIFLDQIVASLGLQIKISLQYKKTLTFSLRTHL